MTAYENHNRHTWEFEYTAKKLAEAAIVKRDAHKAKLQWWEGKKQETLAKVRESGIEVTESLAVGYSNKSASFGPQVSINDALAQQLTEAHTKIIEHERMTREYDGWRQVLEANAESRLKLHHDDWLYFFGA